MSVTPEPAGGTPLPDQYEIRLAGHLSRRWKTTFDGFHLLRDSDGTTVLSGPVVDQSALHGVLRKVRDLGVPLISVTRVRDGQQTVARTEFGQPSTDEIAPA